MMHCEVHTCRRTESLEDVARRLWEHDVGGVPVVAESGAPIGMITDRDICMAALFSGKPLGEMIVEDILTSEGRVPAITCWERSSVADALETMKRGQVRRLPVVDDSGHLVGLVSVADLAQATGRVREVRPTAVVDVLRAVTAARGFNNGAPEPRPTWLD